jgi:Cys-tRNA(Pro) deacylase
MSKKNSHVSETPATQLLRTHKVEFTEHPYEYLEHGGTMHGDCKVSTKNLARQIGAKSVEPCKPEVANRHSGYLVGGTSPFGTRRTMPVYIEESILALPRIAINGGRRGFLVQLDPQACVRLLDARPVHCALAE